MGLFKKKGIDVLDLTLLQKRGILKVPEEKDLDLTRPFAQSSSSLAQNSTESSAFGFLDNLASNSSASNSAPSFNNSDSNLEVQGLKNKLEDFEYKLERLLERLDSIETKLRNTSVVS